jgi:hypothetical protein
VGNAMIVLLSEAKFPADDAVDFRVVVVMLYKDGASAVHNNDGSISRRFAGLGKASDRLYQVQLPLLQFEQSR